MKVGIVCSPGGHLAQALSMLPAFQGHDCFLIVQKFPAMREIQAPGIKTYYKLPILLKYSDPLGIILSLFCSVFALFFIFLKEKPRVLFSTGAEIALPAFWIARHFFGAKIIFLESLTRHERPSGTGKAVSSLADLFLVQDESLTAHYQGKAEYAGSLL